MTQLTVLFFKETDAGRWVAQCLEYDLCASAESLADLPSAFDAAVEGHKAICVAEGVEPFESLPEAPSRYRRMFLEAAGTFEPRVSLPIRISRAYVAPPPRYALANG